MGKEVKVLSLGGSLIISDKVNIELLEKFRKTLLKNKKYRFVVVCGGGKTARNYIRGLEDQKIKRKELKTREYQRTNKLEDK
jgi:uridylate kinase